MGTNKSHKHDKKQNQQPQPVRQSHAIPASSVDWMPCQTCKGRGEIGSHACPDCLGTRGAYVTR